MIKYFAVSDTHSFYSLLIKALEDKKFDFNNPDHKLIICGDAFDRGEETLQLFEFIKKLKAENRLIYVLGNHEDLLYDCCEEIKEGITPSHHHFSNGTVKTICHFCKESEWIVHDPTYRSKIYDIMEPVLKFIKDTAINYFTLGNKVFVHSWIPCKIKGIDYSWNPTYIGIDEIWDKDPNILNKEDLNKYNYAWSQARWDNPFLKWKNKLYPEDKCIVFGHFHCSYGHSRIDMKCKEWPQSNRENWQDAFKPWIKENAIGIDACTAYSGFVNCLVFDEEGNLIEY